MLFAFFPILYLSVLQAAAGLDVSVRRMSRTVEASNNRPPIVWPHLLSTAIVSYTVDLKHT